MYHLVSRQQGKHLELGSNTLHKSYKPVVGFPVYNSNIFEWDWQFNFCYFKFKYFILNCLSWIKIVKGNQRYVHSSDMFNFAKL